MTIKKPFKSKLNEKMKEEKKKMDKPPEPPKEMKKEEPKEKKHGLNQKLKDIDEKLEMITETKKHGEKAKKKSFKLPLGMKGKLKKLAVKNKVQVMLLQHNKNILPTIGEIKEGLIVVGEKYYNGSDDVIWLWNGKIPTTIIPEWDLQPLTKSLLVKDAEDNKRIAHPQTIIIRALELKEALKLKKATGSVIWYILGGLTLAYVLFGQG